MTFLIYHIFIPVSNYCYFNSIPVQLPPAVLPFVLLFPEQIVGFFTQPTETEVLALAKPYMRAAFWLYLSCCLMSTPLGHINGVGFTTLNLVIAVLDGVICRIGLSILLGKVLDWGVAGFWWGNSLAAYISVFLGWGYYLFGHWRERDVLLK